MKALRFYAPEDVRLEEVPEPECGPDEIKLRVRNCSTCGTDVKIFYNGHQNLTPPRIIGHEIAGEVVEVGADVQATYGGDWKVGDRAQVIAAVPCGDCYECDKGWMAVCQNQTSVGYQYDGGFAEYMIVPQQVLKVDGLNRIPDNVGYDEASAAEPFACAINAQELLGIEEGDTVVVFGAGPIGCMHIRIARGVHKVGPVYLVDVNAERLKMSADAVQPDETINGAEVDVVERVMELTGGRGPTWSSPRPRRTSPRSRRSRWPRATAGSRSSAGCPRPTRSSSATPTSSTTASCTSTAPTARPPSTTSGRWSTSPPARCRSRT